MLRVFQFAAGWVCGLGSLNSWVAAFALKVGQWLTGLYHYGGGLTASTTLPHDFRRQFYDWLGGRCHRLIRLGSELGFAKRNRSTSFSHRKIVILAPALINTHILAFLFVIASIGQCFDTSYLRQRAWPRAPRAAEQRGEGSPQSRRGVPCAFSKL